VWTADEWEHIRAGRDLTGWGERWRVVVEPPWLRCERRLSGLTVYGARFEATLGGWRMVEALVCGDRGRYAGGPPEHERGRLEALVRSLMPGQAQALRRSPARVDAADRPPPGTFWVDDGWILAGPAPRAPADHVALRRAGVSHVIDLREPWEGGASLPPGLGMTRSVWPLRRGERPGPDRVRDLLDAVDGSLAAGSPVYLHGTGGQGRASLVAGCWLIRHGVAEPEDALRVLRDLRRGCPHGHEPSPRSLPQRHLVEHWAERRWDEPARPSLPERLAGAVWGHLVGDALGLPYEFWPAGQIASVRWGQRGSHEQPPGTWSDDGGLMLALLDSLLSAGFDPCDQGRRALTWLDRPAYKPGPRFDARLDTVAALRAIEAGVAATDAGDTSRRGPDGALMRILPVALTGRALTDAALVERASRAAAVTHAHPLARGQCALYCLLVRELLERGGDREAALAAAIAAAGETICVNTFERAWQAFRVSDSYAETVRRAIRFGDDTDTTACLAGGLAGAYWGLRGIPQEWLDGMRAQGIVWPLLEKMNSAQQALPHLLGEVARRAGGGPTQQDFVGCECRSGAYCCRYRALPTVGVTGRVVRKAPWGAAARYPQGADCDDRSCLVPEMGSGADVRRVLHGGARLPRGHHRTAGHAA
jgi:ADP-ribosylglycohydrolase